MNIDVAEYRGEQLSADSQALSLQDDEFRSLTSTLGGRIAYEVDQPWGVLVPQLRFAWVHEFEDEASLYRGRLLPQNLASEEDSDTGYSLALDSPERDYFNLGLGLSAEFGGNGAAFLSYEKVFGKKDLSTYSVTGGVRFEF
jgi:outer membrane autotransporter protein